ncbi:MAG TPA: PilZ domain-containing protein [Gemmatimonadales bacterium]|nr:PilZ domain-containing protein [Gemmatimonadales bacterium]
MTGSIPTPSFPAGQERRRQVRVAFSPVRRPKLRLPDGVYDVLDASLDGLRVRHADPQRPAVGARVAGHLEWPDLGTPIAIDARIVRVEPSEVALNCDQGQMPIAHVLAEAARRRDVREGKD